VIAAEGRVEALRSTRWGRERIEQDWAVLDELVAVAGARRRSPPRSPLNRVADQPA
jgi:hypothetical protein